MGFETLGVSPTAVARDGKWPPESELGHTSSSFVLGPPALWGSVTGAAGTCGAVVSVRVWVLRTCLLLRQEPAFILGWHLFLSLGL